ncbi:MAG: hypothetical protein WKF34_01125 [Pyrinomonadaceae bacterium]
MKRFFFTLVVILSFVLAASATPSRTVTLRIGQQKFLTGGKLSVRFVLVAEDSRCPIDTSCIWEGNAKIKVVISKRGRGEKTLELNSAVKPFTASAFGYEFRLEDLSPRPDPRRMGGKGGRIGPARFATVRISVTNAGI